jgi:hypothetical protein
MSMAARLPTVSKFLCYFELTTGGYVLGGFDAVVYGVILLALLINLLTGILDSAALNQFSMLGITMDEVVQLVMLFFFFLMSIAFLSGIKNVSCHFLKRFSIHLVLVLERGKTVHLLRGARGGGICSFPVGRSGWPENCMGFIGCNQVLLLHRDLLSVQAIEAWR